ncbi:hypothetical protein ACEZDB_09860 [Streptacidiphilus sp. N1-3]|uniref:Uncharacterized protein n=1 Tax=Streptacidiphilus alkalitolerans TaxID=3342712 RepID=A0ABV6WY53_9ACTN
MLTIVHLPLTGDTNTAPARRGTRRNGTPLRPSAKPDPAATQIGTGQARPGEDAATHRRIGESASRQVGHRDAGRRPGRPGLGSGHPAAVTVAVFDRRR